MSDWALITGASEGLGREFALCAAEAGLNLILAARQGDKLRALGADLAQRYGVQALAVEADLSKPGAGAALWQKAIEGRRVTALVNNAGLGANGAFGSTIAARESAVMAVNMTALTELMQSAVQTMKAQGAGRILNVASTAAFMPGPGMAVYHASKAYVLSLSEAVAEELKGTPVTVTALCPGATATHFAADAGIENIAIFRNTRLPSAESVARAGWRAMGAGKRRHVPGAMNKIFAFLPRILPRRLVPAITARFLR